MLRNHTPVPLKSLINTWLQHERFTRKKIKGSRPLKSLLTRVRPLEGGIEAWHVEFLIRDRKPLKKPVSAERRYFRSRWCRQKSAMSKYKT
jgi:hypothetical protein